jgi:hypothetical protein
MPRFGGVFLGLTEADCRSYLQEAPWNSHRGMPNQGIVIAACILLAMFRGRDSRGLQPAILTQPTKRAGAALSPISRSRFGLDMARKLLQINSGLR